MRLAATITVATATLLGATTAGRARQQAFPPPPVLLSSPERDAAGEAAAREAIANMAKVKTQARWLHGGVAEYPEAERLAGRHGTTMVTGVLGEDGRLRFAMVSKSSGAPALDRLAEIYALQAAFEPAKDADGKPLAVPVTIPQAFYAYRSPNLDTGLVRYSCRQFAVDQDWWRATFPEAKGSDHDLYAMMLGLGMVAKDKLPGMTADGLKTTVADFGKRWTQAIDTCRANPDKRFVEVLQPEGAYVEALAKPKS